MALSPHEESVASAVFSKSSYQLHRISKLVPGPVRIYGHKTDGISSSLDRYPYERLVVQMALRLFPNGRFIDVGAHIGNHSIVWAKNCCQVISFEPNPVTAEIFRHNIEINALSKQVQVKEVALGDYESIGSVHSPDPSNSGMSQIVHDPTGTIPIQRLDGIVDAGTFDLIKIDAEHMEIRVLRGMKGRLVDTRPIIIVECHESLRDVSALLVDYGYSRIPWSFASSPTYVFFPRRRQSLRLMRAIDLLARAFFVVMKNRIVKQLRKNCLLLRTRKS